MLGYNPLLLSDQFEITEENQGYLEAMPHLSLLERLARLSMSEDGQIHLLHFPIGEGNLSIRRQPEVLWPSGELQGYLVE